MLKYCTILCLYLCLNDTLSPFQTIPDLCWELAQLQDTYILQGIFLTQQFGRNSIFYLLFGILYDSLYKFRIVQIFYPLGDYDLKVMRQEYYINRQKAVCVATYVDYVCFS